MPARKRTIQRLPPRSPSSAISGSTTPSRQPIGRMHRPKVSATTCPLMPGAACRPNSTRCKKRLRRRSNRPLRRLKRFLQRPVAAIVGGAKISSKLDLLGNLIAKVDILIIGGAMANTFLAAQGKNVGKSLCEDELAGTARDILAKAQARDCEIVLPVDVVVAKKFEANAPSRVVDVDHVRADEMILDIGPRSVEYAVSVLARAKTLVWNGPFGAFEMEPFDNGTVAVAEAAAELTQAGHLVSVAGGGDTVAALNAAGVTERFTYVSTAGGAFFEWMEGRALPGVEILKVK